MPPYGNVQFTADSSIAKTTIVPIHKYLQLFEN